MEVQETVKTTLEVTYEPTENPFERFDAAFDAASKIRHQLVDEEEKGLWKLQVLGDSGWRDVAPPGLSPYYFHTKRHAEHMLDLLYPELRREVRLGGEAQVRATSLGSQHVRVAKDNSGEPSDAGGS